MEQEALSTGLLVPGPCSASCFCPRPALAKPLAQPPCSAFARPLLSPPSSVPLAQAPCSGPLLSPLPQPPSSAPSLSPPCSAPPAQPPHSVLLAQPPHSVPLAQPPASAPCTLCVCVCVCVQLVDEWSGQSYRVLAVAMAQLPHLATFQLARMSQQQVEDQAGRFQLLGLIILSNHINSHSKATVQQLQER